MARAARVHDVAAETDQAEHERRNRDLDRHQWRPSVEKPNIASASPSPASAKPTPVERPAVGSRMSGMKRLASTMPSTPIGRLIRKIQRQSK